MKTGTCPEFGSCNANPDVSGFAALVGKLLFCERVECLHIIATNSFALP